MTRCTRCGTALDSWEQVQARRKDGLSVTFCRHCYSILLAKRRDSLAIQDGRDTENKANQPSLWPYAGYGLAIIILAAFIYIRLNAGELQRVGL